MKLLSASLLLARIHGMEIRFHFSMLLTLPLAYYLFEPVSLRDYIIAFSWLTGFTLCILLHELGHALAARLFGVEVQSVVIWVLGGFTRLSRRADKPSHNLAISAAGPLVNMGLAFVFVALYIFIYQLPAAQNFEDFIFIQQFGILSFSLAAVNLILAAFNLLPLYPLDGGNILHSFLEMLFGKSNADLITLIVGIPVLLSLFAFGVFVRDYLLIFSALLIGLALSALSAAPRRGLTLALSYLFNRGSYYTLKEDFDRAIQILTEEINREPNQPNYYIARASCFLHLMQPERAKADAERALRLAPNHLAAMQLRGELYMLEKDNDRAMELFNRALKLNPNWGVLYFDRASLMMEKKEYASALAELNHAIDLMPQYFLFYLIRSTAHFRLGDMPSAHRDQDEALRLDEKKSLVMADFNLILYEDFLDWAEDYYARVISLRPRLAYAYWGRADAYRVNKLHDEAILDYTRVIEWMPNAARLYLARGKSYQALGNMEKAQADFQSAVQIADKPHLARQAKDLLKHIENARAL